MAALPYPAILKVTSLADRVSLSLQRKSLALASSGPEVETEPGQAAPDLGRQAKWELLVGRQGIEDKPWQLHFQESMPMGFPHFLA